MATPTEDEEATIVRQLAARGYAPERAVLRLRRTPAGLSWVVTIWDAEARLPRQLKGTLPAILAQIAALPAAR